jgi:hypothetical protein
MERTKELLKMQLNGSPKGIDLVLDVIVDLMAELCGAWNHDAPSIYDGYG